MNNKTFLIEIGTEEMPPKLIIEISKNFYNNFKFELNKNKIKYSTINLFHSPRRIAINIEKLNTYIIKKKNTYRGPSIKSSFDDTGKLTISALKWLKKMNINIQQTKKMITNQGEWLLYESYKQNTNIEDILIKIIISSIKKLEKYKNMIWNKQHIKFIRPVRSITILLDKKSIKTNILEINSKKFLYGNIFTIPSKIKISHAKEYEKILYEKGKVIANFEQRKQIIFDNSNEIAKKLNGKLNISNQMLEEVACLVEWPVILYGKFQKNFLKIPKEILIYVIESVQKCFPIYHENNQLTNYFIIIANTISEIKNHIILGNERVLHAKLSDIHFFLENDIKNKIEKYFPLLKKIIFHENLGSMYEKSKRLIQLIQYVIRYTKADPKDSIRSAYLSKCDLKTQMVYEFPELQGIVGMNYANYSQESKNVAIALKEQYQPTFSGDKIPSNKVGYSLSITDKIDSIVGFFLINQEPKKKKDPFGIRRLTIGIIRIIIKKNININLHKLIDKSINTYNLLNNNENIKKKIIEFIFNRLYIWYKKQKYNTNIIQSVFICNHENLLDIHKKIQTISKFQHEISFKNLIVTKKRINKLIKKLNCNINRYQQVSFNLMKKKEEKILFQEIQKTKKTIYPFIKNKKYDEILHSLFKLNIFINNFLDKISIEYENENIKINRIALLIEAKKLFLNIADF
ncbi:glycine--tRNA ligase subunit beta [Buchnera aphidicola]|uniref:glycine--tRNA ligase subunit beta n=1 Tax=Buchnera aphidicola TaxID=9 RepID=UPI0034639A4A